VGDELTVSVGGGTRVATDELFGEAATLGAVHGACSDWADRARYLHDRLVHTGLDDAPRAGGDGAAFPLAHARSLLGGAADGAERLHRSLVQSAERYGASERAISGLWDLGVRYAAGLAGATFPLWVLPGAWLAFGLRGAAAQGWWDPERKAGALLADPAFIRLVRSSGGALDEAVLGRLGVPPALAMLLGRGIGTPENANLLLGTAAALGLFGSRVFVDGPVTVRRSSAGVTGPVRAPAGIADLAKRVPNGGVGTPQIRVERYGTAASARWIVYVTGTIASSPVTGAEPWDVTSDVHGLADDSPSHALRLGERAGGADRAVRQALTEAGARPGDPVISVGHSLGGIVAAQLASDPELNLVGAVNLGGPIASADLGEVPVLSLEHEDDVIPALAGPGHPSPGLVTVRREALTGGETGVMSAHELARYRDTAALVDEAKTPEVIAFADLVRDFTGGDDGERSEWRADRVSRAPGG
jgi:hypothetical protein